MWVKSTMLHLVLAQSSGWASTSGGWGSPMAGGTWSLTLLTSRLGIPSSSSPLGSKMLPTARSVGCWKRKNGQKIIVYQKEILIRQIKCKILSVGNFYIQVLFPFTDREDFFSARKKFFICRRFVRPTPCAWAHAARRAFLQAGWSFLKSSGHKASPSLPTIRAGRQRSAAGYFFIQFNSILYLISHRAIQIVTVFKWSISLTNYMFNQMFSVILFTISVILICIFHGNREGLVQCSCSMLYSIIIYI